MIYLHLAYKSTKCRQAHIFVQNIGFVDRLSYFIRMKQASTSFDFGYDYFFGHWTSHIPPWLDSQNPVNEPR